MGERLLCKQEVIGSIPFTSTNSAGPAKPDEKPDEKAPKPTGGNAGIGTNEFPVHHYGVIGCGGVSAVAGSLIL